MIKSKNPVYWLLKIKNPTHQIDENLGLNPGWVFWFSSLGAFSKGDSPNFTFLTFEQATMIYSLSNDMIFQSLRCQHAIVIIIIIYHYIPSKWAEIFT